MKLYLKKKKLSIAIPASIIADIPHLREKTSKIGLIGRSAAIFRVGQIIVYPDDPSIDQSTDLQLITLLLSYLETPQYLRKNFFKLQPELRYVGIIPPLRTPHHPTRKSFNKQLSGYREGLVLGKSKHGVHVDVGLRKSVLLPNQDFPIGKRITIKITLIINQVTGKLVDRSEIPEYWGYTILAKNRPLGKTLTKVLFDLKIATSKYGATFKSTVQKMIPKWKNANSILIIFGAPSQGLHKILQYEQLDLNKEMDFVINTIPYQGTATVRTEEAIIASLSLMTSLDFI